MMNIEAYYAKLEAAIEARKSTKTTKSSRKGLLAPSSSEPKPTGKEKNQMMTIVEIIEGIREAREGMTNGKK